MLDHNLQYFIRRVVRRVMPAPLFHLAFSKQAHGMRSLIETADVVSSTVVDVPGFDEPCYRLILANGTIINSTSPHPNDVKLTHLARRELGLGPEYSKALVDLVLRYLYPHALVAGMTIPIPEDQRINFHLQHQNLPQETRDFSAAQKDFLLSHFTPRTGWNVIDIGCYLGHGTTHVAQLVGPSGRVLGVEAIPANAIIAGFQLSENGLTHAEVFNRAIWSKAGENIQMNVTQNQINAIASDVVSSPRKKYIKTTSIREMTDILGAAADLVSLTVNGAEVEALDSLGDMPFNLRPYRMLMPGWYPMGRGSRAEILTKKLVGFGYETLVTRHDFVIAWRHDSWK